MKGVALITGGASGIGAATARAFVRKGITSLVLVDLRQDALDTFVAELRAEYPDADKSESHLVILPVQCDVSDEVSVKEMMQCAVERFGRIDYAVNGAGITNKSKVGEYQTFDSGIMLHNDEERVTCDENADRARGQWDKVIGVNQRGVFFCMREQLAQMEKQELFTADSTSDKRRAQRGSIVNICSINSFVAARRNAAYVTSKHAIVGLTKTCALDYAAQGIRCNGVAPGYVETPITLAPENVEVLRKSTQPDKTPQGRPALPEEIADVIVFLSGEGASFVNGAIWEIDGGFLTL